MCICCLVYNITEEYQDIIGLRLDNSTGPLVGSKAFGQNEPWYAGIMKTVKKVYADVLQMFAPAPAATPLTAAITGFSIVLIFNIIGL